VAWEQLSDSRHNSRPHLPPLVRQAGGVPTWEGAGPSNGAIDLCGGEEALTVPWTVVPSNRFITGWRILPTGL